MRMSSVNSGGWIRNTHYRNQRPRNKVERSTRPASKQFKSAWLGWLSRIPLAVDSRSDTLYHPPIIAMGGLGEPPDTDWKNARTSQS